MHKTVIEVSSFSNKNGDYNLAGSRDLLQCSTLRALYGNCLADTHTPVGVADN